MRSAPPRSLTRPWPRPHPPPSSSRSSKWPRRSNKTRTGCAGTCRPRAPSSAVTAGDNVAHGHPCPRLAHLLRAAIAPAACCSSSSRLSHKAREQRLASPQSAAGAWCAWWQTSRCPDRPSRDTPAGPLTQKALSGGLSGRETPPKLGNGAVYEISGVAHGWHNLCKKCTRKSRSGLLLNAGADLCYNTHSSGAAGAWASSFNTPNGGTPTQSGRRAIPAARPCQRIQRSREAV